LSEDTWVVASADEDDHRVLFRFRTIIPPGVVPSHYPELVNIYWPYDGAANNGMPDRAVHDRMVKLENTLDSLEGPSTGFLVLSITGNNRKEWVWYVRKRATFMKAVNEILSGVERFPIEFAASSDPNWDNYRALLASVEETEH
jgi:hypothetical protein